MSPSEALNRRTRDEWRELGFYYELADERRLWRLVGAKRGLLRFGDLLLAYANDARNNRLGQHEHCGPYAYLTIATDDHAWIDGDAIHGTPKDLRRLAHLVRSKVAAASEEEEIHIGPEYAPDAEYGIALAVRPDSFDPSSADPAVQEATTLPSKAGAVARAIGRLNRISTFWVVASFLVAVGHLWLLRNLDPRILVLFLLPPGLAVLTVADRASPRPYRVLAAAFLLCISIGVSVAAFPTILPGMKGPGDLPPAESRIFGWYLLTYLTFLLVVMPPVLFGHGLWRRWQGDRRGLSKFTCYLGLCAWLLIGPLTVRFVVVRWAVDWLKPT